MGCAACKESSQTSHDHPADLALERRKIPKLDGVRRNSGSFKGGIKEGPISGSKRSGLELADKYVSSQPNEPALEMLPAEN